MGYKIGDSMKAHRPETSEPITIGNTIYEADKDGYYYFPHEYKIYNPVEKPIKKVKKKVENQDS